MNVMKWSAIVSLVMLSSICAGSARAQSYNLLPSTTQNAGWSCQQVGTAKATMDSGGQTNGVEVTVSQMDGTDWHAQLVSPSVDVTEGSAYTLSFVARANAPMHFNYDLTTTDGDYHTVGLFARADVTTAWHKYRYTFQAVNCRGHHTHINFILGSSLGTVWVSSVKLAEGASTQISDGVSPSDWFLELHDPARATMVQDGDALRVTTTSADGTDWHIQLYQSGIALVDGQNYVLSFDAKADRLETVGLSVTNQTNFQPAGLGVSINLAPSWQRISYTFKAKLVQGQLARLPDLNLGAHNGVIWIKNAVLTPTQ